MAITFPVNPADGTLYQLGGITYKYSITNDKWVSVGSQTSGGSGAVPPNDIYAGLIEFDANTGVFTVTRNDTLTLSVDLDGRYVDKKGDTMQGALILQGNPVANLEAVTKEYVDTLVASADVYTTSAAMANGSLVQTRTDGTTYSVDMFAALDGRYVNITGDTMTGPLTVMGDTNFLGTTTANNLIANGTTTLNGDVYTNSYLYSNNVIVDGTATFNDNVYVNETLSANNLTVSNNATFGGNTTFNGTSTTFNSNVEITQTLNANNLVISGTLQANAVTLALADLTDVSDTAATANQVLQWNGVAWVPSSLPPNTVDTKLNNLTFDANTRILTAAVSDGNVYTALIPSDTDKFVNAVTYDANTRLLTISRTDGQVFTSTIPDQDLFVNLVTFNDTTNTLTVNRNDGTVFSAVIPNDDKFINTAAFNNSTRTLDLTRNDGTVLSAIIPDEDKFINAATFNNTTRTLTITRNDGVSFTPVIPDNNTFTNTMTFDTTSRVLTLARNDGVQLTAVIPQASVSSLIDSVVYNDTTRVLTVTKADGTSSTYTVSDKDVKLSGLAFNNTTRVLTATSSDGNTHTVTIPETPQTPDVLTTLSLSSNILTYKDELGNNTNIDLSLYLDDTNLARLVSGTVDATGLATFTRDDGTSFTVDLSSLKVENLTSLSYNSANNILTYKDENGANTAIQLVGGGASVTVAATAPTGPSDGDLWYDTTKVRTFVWLASSNVWVDAAPGSAPTDILTTLTFNGTTGNLTYKDEAAANTVIKLVPNGTGVWQAPMWGGANGWVPEPIVASRLATAGTDTAYVDLYNTNIIGSSGITVGAGHTYYNTNSKQIRVYDGSAWNSVGVDTVDAPYVNNGASGSLAAISTGARSFKITMTGALTITAPTGLDATKEIGVVLHIVGNGSAITWPASFKWNGGTAPSNPPASKEYLYIISTIDGGTTWYASQNGSF